MNDDSILPARPAARWPLLDYNPFYLLSAMCMLAGLFSLNDSLDFSPIPVRNLIWLLLILNFYELLLVGLGMFLARHGLMRDAATLFILEAFFLVDAGFLNSEVFTHSFRLGLVINLALLLLAVVKVGGVMRALRIPLLDGRFVAIMAQMAVLLGIPGVFKYVSQTHQGNLPPLTLYAMWWIVGLIPILYLLLLPHGPEVRTRYRGIVAMFVILPAVSILAHLCTSNWVYHVRWYHGNLSPLLLGLAIAVGASDHHVGSVAARMRLQLVLPVLAILLAWPLPSNLSFAFSDSTMMTPLRLTLLACVIVYGHGLVLHRHPYFAAAGSMCLLAAGLGDTPATMTASAVNIGDRSIHSIWSLVPRTVKQWGLVSVVASFVLLGVGLMRSLLRPVREEIDDLS